MFKSRQPVQTQENADSIFLLAYLAEIREWDNRPHLKRMKSYAYTLCTALQVPGIEAESIALACQLHDIGKATTPLELLLRKGEYTNQEWHLMEKHTLQGGEILRGFSSPILQMGAAIALTHHERWDGSGYPNKLVGEAVPLSGRICAVADVFDALTTKRLYKEPIDNDQALALIRRSSGTLFDPNVVQAFTDKFPEILEIKKSSAE
jgi:putative two-component system response regulator